MYRFFVRAEPQQAQSPPVCTDPLSPGPSIVSAALLSVYGASNATQCSRLQKIVRFAARLVSGRRKYDHVSDVLDDLGWLHVDSMYKYRYLTLGRKMLDTSEPLQVAGSLATRQSLHERDTRQSGQLLTPSIRSESGRRRFLYTAVSEYNGLPHELRSLSSARFARGLREYLWQKQRVN